MEIIKVLVVALLGFASIMDLKWKKINLIFLLPFVIAGLICSVLYKVVPITYMIGGVAIGVSVLIISLVTKGKIGSGDGVVLMITGMCLGFFDNLFLLLTAAFLSAIVGIFLLLIKKVNRNYEIPFIPFLFVSFVGGLFL